MGRGTPIRCGAKNSVGVKLCNSLWGGKIVLVVKWQDGAF